MKILLLMMVTMVQATSVVVSASSFEKAAYQWVGIWTGGNNFSSAPVPSCSCDLDDNSQDCPETFVSDADNDDICYDEYIPSGSRGWVHAGVYKRM